LRIIEMLCGGEGLARSSAWRDTPSTATRSGGLARASQPYIEQIFVRSARAWIRKHWERKLYVVRKPWESAIDATDHKGQDSSYIPSLSSRTIIYKGLRWRRRSPTFTRSCGTPI